MGLPHFFKMGIFLKEMSEDEKENRINSAILELAPWNGGKPTP